jgi:hypothetical protein
MLRVLVDGHKMPPRHLAAKKDAKGEGAGGSDLLCEEKDWMTNELMIYWIKGCLEPKTRLPSQKAWDACSRSLQRTPYPGD